MLVVGVYFIQRVEPGGNGPIKIGRSNSSVEYRLQALQCSSPEPLVLLATHPKPHHEHAIHVMFRRSHIRGEWYRADADLLAFIEQVRVGTARVVESSPRTMGGVALTAILGEGRALEREVSKRCSARVESIRLWAEGSLGPLYKSRKALLRHYGIPMDAWDEPNPIAEAELAQWRANQEAS